MKSNKIKVYATLGLGLIFLVICIFSLISDSKISSDRIKAMKNKKFTQNKKAKTISMITRFNEEEEAEAPEETDDNTDDDTTDDVDPLVSYRDKLGEWRGELAMI